MIRRFCQALFLTAAAADAGAAALSTMGQSAAGHDVVSYNAWQASSFKLAEGAGGYRVRSVDLHLAQIVPNANLVLRITGSASGHPDISNVRAVLRIPERIPTSPGAVSFEAAASPDPLLEPGHTYWLVLGITAPDNEQPLPAGLIRWSYAAASAADETPASGWSQGGITASSGTGGSAWEASVNTPYLFAIHARPPSYMPPASPAAEWSGGRFTVSASGSPGVEYDIEASENLTAWSLLGSAFADASGGIRFTDPAGLSRRFYRFR